MISKDKIADFAASQVQHEVGEVIKTADKHGQTDRDWLFEVIINAVCKCFGKPNPTRAKARISEKVGTSGRCTNCKKLIKMGNFNNFCESCGAEIEHKHSKSSESYLM